MGLYKARLLECIAQKRSNLCLGVDLHRQELPRFFEAYRKANGMNSFVKKWVHSLIEVASQFIPAIKFQSSFFEALGVSGYELLPSLVQEASAKGLITILDVKRCDIASTMEGYGYSAFEQIKADAMTIVPYMGADVIRPLYSWMEKGHGVYSVFLSSNPSGFEKLSTSVGQGKNVAEHFHEDVFKELSSKKLQDSFGLVVGASSYQKENKLLAYYRDQFPFLLPGLGFQGGVITKTFCDLIKEGSSHLFPLSRSLTAIGAPGLSRELADLSSFAAYEEFVAARVLEYQKAFLALYRE